MGVVYCVFTLLIWMPLIKQSSAANYICVLLYYRFVLLCYCVQYCALTSSIQNSNTCQRPNKLVQPIILCIDLIDSGLKFQPVTKQAFAIN